MFRSITGTAMAPRRLHYELYLGVSHTVVGWIKQGLNVPEEAANPR